jgi:hypothetical protein
LEASHFGLRLGLRLQSGYIFHPPPARRVGDVDGAAAVGVGELGERGSGLDGLAEPVGVGGVGEHGLEEGGHRQRVGEQEGVQLAWGVLARLNDEEAGLIRCVSAAFAAFGARSQRCTLAWRPPAAAHLDLDGRVLPDSPACECRFSLEPLATVVQLEVVQRHPGAVAEGLN